MYQPNEALRYPLFSEQDMTAYPVLRFVEILANPFASTNYDSFFLKLDFIKYFYI